MKLVDVTTATQNIFFRCLQEEQQVGTQLIEIRRRWYKKNKEKGLRTKLLLLDNRQLGGLCQYIPIEHSHLIGEDLLVILCLRVHGYEHGVGIQQGKGYGRFMLDSIDKEAHISGAKGIAAWGIEWEINWMPASFFDRMGYIRVDEEEKVIVFWNSFCSEAKPPKLLRIDNPPSEGTDKVNVTVAVNGWCLGCYKLLYAREVVEGLDDIMEYIEQAFQPYQICNKDELRTEIIRLYEQKKRGKMNCQFCIIMRY